MLMFFIYRITIFQKISTVLRKQEHTVQHKQTHVEVEVLSPEFLKIPTELANKIGETAVVSSGMKVASKGGLVALKLRRGNLQDQADIVEGHAYSARYWMTNAWESRVHDLEWLIEMFSPVPTWGDDWQGTFRKWHEHYGI